MGPSTAGTPLRPPLRDTTSRLRARGGAMRKRRPGARSDRRRRRDGRRPAGGETREGPDRPVDNGARSGSQPDGVGPKGGPGPDPSPGPSACHRNGERRAGRCTVAARRVRAPRRQQPGSGRTAPTVTSTATGEQTPPGLGRGGSPTSPRRSWGAGRHGLGARLGVAAVSGALVAVAFPPYDIWPLAPIGVALLVLACRGVRRRVGALLGLVHGLATFLPLLSWMTVIGPDAWILLALLEAAFLALMGALLPPVLRLPGWPAWVACLWVTQEAARDRLPFGGFPWGRLAFAETASPFHAVRGDGRCAAGELRDRPLRDPAGRRAARRPAPRPPDRRAARGRCPGRAGAGAGPAVRGRGGASGDGRPGPGRCARRRDGLPRGAGAGPAQPRRRHPPAGRRGPRGRTCRSRSRHLAGERVRHRPVHRPRGAAPDRRRGARRRRPGAGGRRGRRSGAGPREQHRGRLGPGDRARAALCQAAPRAVR